MINAMRQLDAAIVSDKTPKSGVQTSEDLPFDMTNVEKKPHAINVGGE